MTLQYRVVLAPQDGPRVEAYVRTMEDAIAVQVGLVACSGDQDEVWTEALVGVLPVVLASAAERVQRG